MSVISSYSVPTDFRIELMEPSAKEVFIFWTNLFEREEMAKTLL